MCTRLWETRRIHVWSDGLQNTHKRPHSLCPNFSVKIGTFPSAWLQWVWRTDGHFAGLVCIIWINVKVWEAFCQTNWNSHRRPVGNAILDWLSVLICTEDWRLPVVNSKHYGCHLQVELPHFWKCRGIFAPLCGPSWSEPKDYMLKYLNWRGIICARCTWPAILG